MYEKHSLGYHFVLSRDNFKYFFRKTVVLPRKITVNGTQATPKEHFSLKTISIFFVQNHTGPKL